MKPDESAIKAHLEMLFAPLREEYPRGLIEICYGPEKPNKAQFFNLHPDGIADATNFAATMAGSGQNIYVGVNPRKPGSHGLGRASDSAVECAIWQFADIDAAASLDGLGRKMRALPPFYTVTTGTVPHRRPHLYWLLDEPVRNMAEWTQRQRGLAEVLGGDAVINPSRIMRLAGTINFPPQHKVQRGYRVELVTLKTEFDDEREPVSPGEIAQAYPAPTHAQQSDIVIPMVGQTTLSAMKRTQVQDLIDACRSGSEWHNNMIRLVAHLAAIGRSSAEILAMADHITLPGYTVGQTRSDMETALRTARQKWDLPEPQNAPVEDEESVREEADSIFDLYDIAELENMPPPTWLIKNTLVDDGLTVLYGDPGSYKSFLALDMGLRLANGMDWHGVPAAATGVLYIAGEGKRGIGKRIKGWRKKHGLEGVEVPFVLLPTAVEITDDQQRAKLCRTIEAAKVKAGFDIGLIVIDTVSRALSGGDENSAEAMGKFVAACDAIKAHAGGALLGVHHSGKDKDRGMRGSTVLLGACDAVMKATKSDDQLTLKTEKQKDAEEAAPVKLVMETIKWATGLEEEQTTLVPMKEAAKEATQNEQIGIEQIRRAFGRMADAWGEGRPLSPHARARTEGRYAPPILARQFGGTAEEWASLIQSWLETECLSFEQSDSRTKSKGLRVLAIPGAQK
jgi:RecA-family ATPase